MQPSDKCFVRRETEESWKIFRQNRAIEIEYRNVNTAQRKLDETYRKVEAIESGKD